MGLWSLVAGVTIKNITFLLSKGAYKEVSVDKKVDPWETSLI